MKYGESSLAEAEDGLRSVPEGIEIDKVILVGTASGGSLRNLREFNRGRSYLGRIGRRWEPETLFTLPALYQDLPSYHEDLFIDGDGRALDVDLYDAASWQRYGWSVFDSEVEKRLAGRDRPDLFADRVSRVGFLTRVLSDAHRFHRLLERDVEDSPGPAYYSIQNDAAATPHRAVLTKADGGWKTLFSGDKEISRLRLDALTTAGGDEHATVASQIRWLDLPLWVWIAGPLAWVVKDLLLLPLVWQAYSNQPSGLVGEGALIGASGLARARLAPHGYVRVGNELWRAELETGESPVPEGARVLVCGVRGLTLRVRGERGDQAMPDRTAESPEPERRPMRDRRADLDGRPPQRD